MHACQAIDAIVANANANCMLHIYICYRSLQHSMHVVHLAAYCQFIMHTISIVNLSWAIYCRSAIHLKCSIYILVISLWCMRFIIYVWQYKKAYCHWSMHTVHTISYWCMRQMLSIYDACYRIKMLVIDWSCILTKKSITDTWSA